MNLITFEKLCDVSFDVFVWFRLWTGDGDTIRSLRPILGKYVIVGKFILISRRSDDDKAKYSKIAKSGN